MLSRTPWSVLGALSLILLAVPGSCVSFNISGLLEGTDGDARPDADTGKKTYSYFLELLNRAEAAGGPATTFFEDGGNFEGTFFAFNDAAVEEFATKHGFSSAAEFNGSSFAMGDYAKQIIMLHKVDKLASNVSTDTFVTAADGSRLRIVTAQSEDGTGNVIDQVFTPTLKMGSKLGKFPDTSIDMVDKTLESDDGMRRIVYTSKMFAPMNLINDMGSRFDNIYDAIDNTAELSFFKSLLDANSNITDILKSSDYDGTVLAPHNEAFRLLLGELGSGLNLQDFTNNDSRFKAIGSEILKYHIMPYNFSVTDLTTKGNGVQEKGRDRIDDIVRGPRGNGGGNGGGQGNNPNNRKLSQIPDDDDIDVENRFQTGRRHSDLRVIKTGSGRALIRGAVGNADIMTTETQMRAGNAYAHVVDQVILPQRIVATKKIADLFGASLVPGGEEVADEFDTIKRLLENSDEFADSAGNLILNGNTFIAPRDEPLKEIGKQKVGDFFSDPSFDQITNLPGDVKTLIEQHIIKWGPADGPFEDGEVYETLAGSKVRYTFLEDSEQDVFEVTNSEVTRLPGRRRLLESTQIDSGSSTTTGDTTIYYSSTGTLATEDDGEFQNLPAFGLTILAAALALFAFAA